MQVSTPAVVKVNETGSLSSLSGFLRAAMLHNKLSKRVVAVRSVTCKANRCLRGTVLKLVRCQQNIVIATQRSIIDSISRICRVLCSKFTSACCVSTIDHRIFHWLCSPHLRGASDGPRYASQQPCYYRWPSCLGWVGWHSRPYTHDLCCGHHLLLLPGVTTVHLPVFLVSSLRVFKPPQSRFRAPTCDVLYLQYVHDVFISHMVSYLSVAAYPSIGAYNTHLHRCRLQLLHVWVVIGRPRPYRPTTVARFRWDIIVPLFTRSVLHYWLIMIPS